MSGDASSPPAAPSLAPFGRRAGARIVDTLLFQGPLTVLLVRSSEVDASGALVAVDLPWWVGAAFLGAAVVYEVVLTRWYGQTLGKALLGVRVVQEGTDGPPTWSRSGVRALVPALLFALPMPYGTLAGIGCYLSAGLDERRRGLHDRAADTTVVALAEGERPFRR